MITHEARRSPAMRHRVMVAARRSSSIDDRRTASSTPIPEAGHGAAMTLSCQRAHRRARPQREPHAVRPHDARHHDRRRRGHRARRGRQAAPSRRCRTSSNQLGLEHAHRARRRRVRRVRRRRSQPAGTQSSEVDLTMADVEGARGRRPTHPTSKRSLPSCKRSPSPASTSARPTSASHGTSPDVLRRSATKTRSPGSFFTNQDDEDHSRSCVIGQTDVKNLFGSENPIGHDREVRERRQLHGRRRLRVEGLQRLPGPGQHRRSCRSPPCSDTLVGNTGTVEHHRRGESSDDHGRRVDRRSPRTITNDPRLSDHRRASSLSVLNQASLLADRRASTSDASRCCSARSPRSRCSSAASAS